MHRGLVPWLFLIVCSSALMTIGLVDAGPAAARQGRELGTTGRASLIRAAGGLMRTVPARMGSRITADVGAPPRPLCGAPNHGLTDGPSRNGWTENHIDKAEILREENGYRSEPGPESVRIKQSLKLGGEYLRKTGGPNADLATLPTFSGPEQAVDGGAQAEDNASKITLDKACYKTQPDKQRRVGGVVAELLGGLNKTLGTGVCDYMFSASPEICFEISSIVGNAVAGIIQREITGSPSESTWGLDLGEALDVALTGYPAIHGYVVTNIGLWMGRTGSYLKNVASHFDWFKWAGISAIAVRAGDGIIATGHAARQWMNSPEAPPTTQRTTSGSHHRHHHGQGSKGAGSRQRHRRGRAGEGPHRRKIAPSRSRPGSPLAGDVV